MSHDNAFRRITYGILNCTLNKTEILIFTLSIRIRWICWLHLIASIYWMWRTMIRKWLAYMWKCNRFIEYCSVVFFIENILFYVTAFAKAASEDCILYCIDWLFCLFSYRGDIKALSFTIHFHHAKISGKYLISIWAHHFATFVLLPVKWYYITKVLYASSVLNEFWSGLYPNELIYNSKLHWE